MVSNTDRFDEFVNEKVMTGIIDINGSETEFDEDNYDTYKVDDYEVFIDSDGGDIWTRVDDDWFMYDPMSRSSYKTDYTWERIVWDFGPIYYLGDC